MVRSQTSFHSRQTSLRSNTSKTIAKKLDKKNDKCLSERSVGKIRNGRSLVKHAKEPSTSDPESETDASYVKQSRFTRFVANKPKKRSIDHFNLIEQRLVAGEDLPPKKRLEHHGREIIQVVEELMDQASILKERLVNMIDYFEDTIGTCTNMVQQSSELRQSVCTCKSGFTLASHCRSKAGSVAPSGAKERHSQKETNSCAETENYVVLPKLPFQRSYMSGLSRKSEQLRPIREDHALSVASASERKGGILSKHSLRQIASSAQCPVHSVHTTRPESCICVRDLQKGCRHDAGASIYVASEGDITQRSQRTNRPMKDQLSKATKTTKIISETEISPKDTTVNYAPSQQFTEDERSQKQIKDEKRRIDNEKSIISYRQTVANDKKISSKSQEKPDGTVATQQIISQAQPTTSIPLNPGIEDKLQQVQRDIQELQKQMTMCATCACTARLGDHGNAFSQTLSGQLLGKANEIKALLNDLKSDCYQRVNMSSCELPDTGKQIVTQKCEKEIRRVHPEFIRTVNQTQHIEADRERSGDVQTAKVVEALETKIGTKYNDDHTSENVILNTKVEALEKLKNSGLVEKQRETKTQTEKTVRTNDQSFKEVNIIDEDDVINKDARVITTTKKVVRTEILDGKEPKEQVITNITIRRVIDNKTGEVTETITETNKDLKPDGRIVDASKGKIEGLTLRKGGGKDVPSRVKLSTQTIVMQPEQLSLSPSKLQANRKEDAFNTHTPQESSIPDDSQESISQFISKRSYIDEDVPPIKVRKTSQPLIASSIADKTCCEIKTNNTEREQAGGADLRDTCSKIRYTLPNSAIPGVNYIGCKDSDMAKYPSHRSKVSMNKRLLVECYSGKKSMRIADPNRYPITKENYTGTQNSEPHALAGSEHELNTISLQAASTHTGAGGEPEVKLEAKPESPPEPPTQKIEQASAAQPTNITNTSATSNVQNATSTAASTAVSKSLKPSFRDRKFDLNRSQGGTSIEVTGAKRPKQQQASSSRDTQAISLASSSQPAESIADLIRKFSGSRSPDDFFVSILPERIELKQFRINVIDKESGKLLGHFFINEAQFKQARDEGVFDNYLSLFVLNSLGSYSDFVDTDNRHLNSKNLQPISCFGKCDCKEETKSKK